MKDGDLHSLWERRLIEYKTSGKSISAWCRDNSVTEGQYHYWRRKLGSQTAINHQPVKWMVVNMGTSPQEEKSSDPIAVNIGQVTVEVKRGFDHELFREIIQVLKTL
jgi:transposase-like protein